MDSQKQIVKLCGVFGNERIYIEFRSLYFLAKYVLLNIQLDTIKLIEIKQL